MEPTIPFTENLDLLECCKISISLESDLTSGKHDFRLLAFMGQSVTSINISSDSITCSEESVVSVMIASICCKSAGMLGVAIGRARKKKGLRLVNFKDNCVIKPVKAVLTLFFACHLPDFYLNF
jgi:hypothetical protein